MAIKTKIKTKNRLATRLAKVAVLIAFLLGLLFSSFQIYIDYREQGDALNTTVAKILSVAERPASTSVHLLSHDLANEVVAGLLEYDYVESAVITDDLNLVLAQQQKHRTTTKAVSTLTGFLSNEHKEYSIDLLAPSISVDSPGKLTVIVNVSVAFKPFYDRALIVFSSGIFRNIVLSVLLIISFYYIITRPLTELAMEFSQRKPSDPDSKTIELPQGHENDEFTTLVASINQFLTGSVEHVNELNQQNQALSDAKQVLALSESKYKRLYQGTDVSIWEEDFSELFDELDRLRQQGVVDIYHHLIENQEYLIELANKIKVLGVNDASLTMFEADSADEFASRISEVFDETTSMEVFAREVEAIWNKDDYFRKEVKQKTLKGNVITTILSLPIPKSRDESTRVAVTLIDTTMLKKAHDQLRKLSLAIQHNPSAIFITDLAGNIEYANPKVTSITGFESGDLIGTNIRDLRVVDSDIPTYEEMSQCLIDGQEWRTEIEARKKNGSVYQAREFMAPIKSETGEVTHLVAIYEDITEEKRILNEVSHRASHDMLTGLINRDEFERRLERVIQTAQQNQSTHVLCFLDLDQFKVINDTSGHIAGDELLRQLPDLLTQHIRVRDTLARIGGDEFAILLEHCDLTQALQTTEIIRKETEDFQFVWEERTYRITVSTGIVLIDSNTLSITDVFRKADLACYVAKDSGRNNIHVYDEKDQQVSLKEGEIHWAAEIAEAVEQNRFRLFAQPIVALQDPTKNNSYEVLLRLESSDGQIVSPASFLPAAERYGLSVLIDKWVIEHVFSWVSDNLEKLKSVQHIAINLSGASLGDASILECIAHQFENKLLPAHLFAFEITETAAIGNLPEAIKFIDEIKQWGCTVALDDFGSGLSSFAYLKNLSVDCLKIDGMFVKDIVDDVIDEAMVKSINDIGHVMGLKTIAEFVENKAIEQRLKEIGVDYVQGYGIGKPMPIDEIIR